jgi:hypothetical protein
MPKPSELDLDILALDPRSSSTKISPFYKFPKKGIETVHFLKLRAFQKHAILELHALAAARFYRL